MTLRNELDALASDGMVRRLLPALSLARDPVDRLRIVIDSGGSILVASYWANQGSYTSWYAQGCPMSVDARETLKQIQRQNAQMRRQRWTIT